MLFPHLDEVSCPDNTPYAFNYGKHCCANVTDCEGLPLNVDSLCCGGNYSSCSGDICLDARIIAKKGKVNNERLPQS